jgi:NAD(P)-dependent dehydrogenase (short-subunit alcohol dehydrogenase family)
MSLTTTLYPQLLGIGRAAALLFAQHGAKVVVSDLDGKKADEVVSLIKEAGGDALAVQGNVMDVNFGDKLIKSTVDKFGKINHIVNNAGFTNDKMLHNLDDATFQQMLDCHSEFYTCTNTFVINKPLTKLIVSPSHCSFPHYSCCCTLYAYQGCRKT